MSSTSPASGRRVVRFFGCSLFMGALAGLASPVSVAISPAQSTVALSASTQLTPKVTGATNTAVKWSLSPQLGTISTTGLYTVPASAGPAHTVTATATSVADSTASASTVITIAPISVSPLRVSVRPGQKTQCAATRTG